MAIRKSMLALGAAAALALAGCSTTQGRVKIHPIKPAYKTQQTIRKFDKPIKKLIRVAQFDDKRPKIEHDGDEPHKWYLLIYNWRRGTYVTGDEAWKEKDAPLASDVSKAVADGLKDTGFFEQVQEEKTADPTGGSGFILKGTVESFVSEEKVVFDETILYDNEKFWPPKGKCKISFVLIDAETNQELLRKSVQGDSNSNKLDLTENGEAAMNNAVQLVNKEVTKALVDF